MPQLGLAGQVNDQKIGDGFRLGANAMNISLAGNPAEHVNQHQNAGLDRVIARCRQKHLDTVTGLGRQQAGIEGFGCKAAIEKSTGTACPSGLPA